jgi:cytochrome c biogenesis protein CcdA
MPTQHQAPARAGRRKGLTFAALWSIALTVAASIVVASWGFTFWPSVLHVAVFTLGVAIPLGLTLSMFIPAAMCNAALADQVAPRPDLSGDRP